MQVGLIGAGQMATALARGWGDPVLCTDVLPARAQALADELGGEAVGSSAELARRADLVVLCHKPAQLAGVAAEVAGQAKAVASILGATPYDAVQAAYPGVPVFRFIPNVAVEVRAGVFGYARRPPDALGDEAPVLDHFRRLGTIVTLEDAQIDGAMALMSCSPAFYAVVVEALAEAGIHEGLPADTAALLATQAMAGTAALIAHKGHDTLAVRRSVTSPGGSTARGLAALEAGGVRGAFHDAVRSAAGRR